MITPKEARRYIDDTGVPYGQNVILPDDVDTSGCQEFFGTRCPHNVHVKDSRVAHVDREDPRVNPVGHLVRDVGIPYASMTAPAGAALGAALMPGDRKTGAAIGALCGLAAGMIIDWAENRRNASKMPPARQSGGRPSPRSSRRRTIR